jgi:beta-aspartyl-peptidase (threonine type)
MHVIAHGGAGQAPDDPDARQTALAEAVSAGMSAQMPERSVVEVVRTLESDPQFNAGVGGAVQSDGTIRTDAGLMTSDGETGAACAMRGVEHAVDVAQVVKRETPHVLLAGERAVGLGEAFGVATGCDLWTPETRERWEGADPPDSDEVYDRLSWLRGRFGADDGDRDHDTVGAVATDGNRLAAATSTGGRWFALSGRVGDVPQVGAGFYATGTAAASATGEGEAIARFGLARRAVGAVADGASPGAAAQQAIERFGAETGASAGVIVLDRAGEAGRAHNAEAMGTAWSGER